jgi:hypothetical protein
MLAIKLPTEFIPINSKHKFRKLLTIHNPLNPQTLLMQPLRGHNQPLRGIMQLINTSINFLLKFLETLAKGWQPPSLRLVEACGDD